MTEPTYFARIENEAEREVAEFLCGDTSVKDFLMYQTDGGYWHSDYYKWACGELLPHVSELIRRFVPLSVIGALAECHDCSVITNGSMRLIDNALEEAGYIKVDEVNDDNT